jgi:DNA polymerase-3 subunit alpha
MEFIFDIETNGLPKFQVNAYNRRLKEFPPAELLEAYDTARIVSIAWVIIDANKDIIQQEYYLIKPDGFNIPPEVVRIHGITNEFAGENGISISEMFSSIHKAISRCSKIISYNIQFDINVLKSELIRYQMQDILECVSSKPAHCAMIMAQHYMKRSSFPKLSLAYEHIFQEPIYGAHNAMDDTISCYKVYKAISLYGAA